MSKKQYLLLLVCILLLAAAVRIWSLGSESYWLDESISINQAQGNYSTAMQLVKDDVHLPLYISLLYVWVHLFGTSEVASRSLSVICGVLSVLLLYLLGKRLFPERTALLAALLLCLSPVMIFYSQETRLYMLFTMLTLASFYCYVLYLEYKTRTALVLYGVCTLFLLYTHLFAFLVLLVQNVHMFYVSNYKLRKMKPWIIGQCALLLLFVPWLPTLVLQLGRTSIWGWIPRPTLNIVLGTVLNVFGNVLNAIIFAALLLAAAAYFVVDKNYFTNKKRKTLVTRNKQEMRTVLSPLPLLLLWAVVPFLLVLLYSLLFSSLYLTRYLLFIIPAWLLLFAMLIDNVGTRIGEQTGGKSPTKTRRYSSCVLWALIALITISSVVSIVYQARTMNKDDWRSVAAFVRQQSNDGDTIYVDPFYNQQPFAYYYAPECFRDQQLMACDYAAHRVLSLDWQAQCCSLTTKVTTGGGDSLVLENQLQSHLQGSIWLISSPSEYYYGNVSLFDYLKTKKTLLSTKDIGNLRISHFQ